MRPRGLSASRLPPSEVKEEAGRAVEDVPGRARAGSPQNDWLTLSVGVEEGAAMGEDTTPKAPARIGRDRGLWIRGDSWRGVGGGGGTSTGRISISGLGNWGRKICPSKGPGMGFPLGLMKRNAAGKTPDVDICDRRCVWASPRRRKEEGAKVLGAARSPPAGAPPCLRTPGAPHLVAERGEREVGRDLHAGYRDPVAVVADGEREGARGALHPAEAGQQRRVGPDGGVRAGIDSTAGWPRLVSFSASLCLGAGHCPSRGAMEVLLQYSKKRKEFGEHCAFVDSPAQMLESATFT